MLYGPNEPDMIKVTTPAGTLLKRTNATMGIMDPRQRPHEMLHPMQTSHHPPPPPPGHYYQSPYGPMPSHGPPTTTTATTTTTTASTRQTHRRRRCYG